MNAPAADRAAIEGFLARAGGEAIHLVAIPAEGGSTQGRWFGADAPAAAAWAADRNAGGANIYWSPNAVRPGLGKKARKEDVVAVRFAHVDVDPPKDGRAFDKQAAVAALRKAAPPPSIIVDSGGGVQALWRLAGDVVSSADVEGINRSLVGQFGGDPACWNVDRVLRVPGTVNLPTARKRASGRVPALATVLEAQGGSSTPEALRRAYDAGMTPERAVATPAPALGVVPASLARLGITPDDPLHTLLTDPPGEDRSADTFAAACDMHRCGVDAEQIVGVLLDPELAISAHCLAQADPERAARRAVERAQAAVAVDGDGFGVLVEASRAASAISATPFAWPAAHTIPPRRWLYGRQLQRGNVCAIVAPGATGKTALTVGMALAMVSGRPLLDHEVHGGPQRVWLYNLEDDADELARSFSAAAWAHGIDPGPDVAGRLFVDSGLSGPGLCTAKQVRHGFTVLEPVYAALKAEIIARQIDCLIVDPFVSSHQVNENDNGAIDAVAKEWAKVAAATDCVIVLVHHTSKAAGAEVTVDRARGASALPNAARSVLVLNRMTPEEGQRFGIEPGEERRFFRVYNDKSNRAPAAAEGDWHEIVSVDLPNGEGDNWIGDSVGVVSRFYPPAIGPAEPLAPTVAAEVQALIAEGEWRDSERAERWAGKAVAQVLGLDPDDKAQRARVKAVLKELLAEGTLAKVERRDGHREMRTWIVPGTAQGHVARNNDMAEEASAAMVPHRGSSTTAPRQGADEPPRRSGTPFRGSTTAARHGGATSDQVREEVVEKRRVAEMARVAPGQTPAAPLESDGSEFL
ncbi:AAA family ATPase [Sphingomonas sp.]|uniref:AAA family ATPase n=1 Tax=Sphingomonas sp. TaxID=28214 RepID=UPI0035C7F98F